MTDQEYPRYLWLDGVLFPGWRARVHVTELGWVGVGYGFEGIKAYRNDTLDGSTSSAWVTVTRGLSNP
jgi:hypothetical protein